MSSLMMVMSKNGKPPAILKWPGLTSFDLQELYTSCELHIYRQAVGTHILINGSQRLTSDEHSLYPVYFPPGEAFSCLFVIHILI